MLTAKLNTLPTRPGVYLFKNDKHKVLYVGKAKSLRSRVRSYFQDGADLGLRKERMVREVADLDILVTSSELEAFILENSLIKRHRPPYNVFLRDDKNYPSLRLTVKEEWPRLEVVRRVKRDGSRYFGPYVPASVMWETLAFIRRTFPIRTCKYRLDKPMRPCVEYQMKRCSGPCGGRISHREYEKIVREVRLFLEGRNRPLLEGLRQRMGSSSEALRFEEAAELRDRIHRIEKAWEQQRIVSPALGDIDVFACYREPPEMAVQILILRGGIVIGGRGFPLRPDERETDEKVLAAIMAQYYARSLLPPKEILLPFTVPDPDLFSAWLSERAEATVRLRVAPARGKRAELMVMARENAIQTLKQKQSRKITPLVQEMKAKFRLSRLPETVHGFDISTSGGSEAVGSRVAWKEGRFDKTGYRHFSIRTIEGMDDFAMMAEIVGRSYREEPPPDLLLIDGGAAQRDAALGALREAAPAAQTEVIGLAKMRPGLPERVYLPGARRPLRLDPVNPVTHLLQRMRDETHRFAITYHRKKRAKKSLGSPLEDVPGIGKKRRLALLKHLGGMQEIRSATLEELAAAPGMTRPAAERLWEAFRPPMNDEK